MPEPEAEFKDILGVASLDEGRSVGVRLTNGADTIVVKAPAEAFAKLVTPLVGVLAEARPELLKDGFYQATEARLHQVDEGREFEFEFVLSPEMSLRLRLPRSATHFLGQGIAAAMAPQTNDPKGKH